VIVVVSAKSYKPDIVRATELGRAPGNVDARLALARAYVRTGNQSEASREYQTLLLIAPERPEARQELSRLRSAAR
jgi:thioredoxin-like negative regulator of GroEL